MKHEYDYFRCNRVVLNNIFKINQIDDLPSTGWVVVGSWDHLVGQGHCRGHAVEHLVQPSEHVLVVSKQDLLGRKKHFYSLVNCFTHLLSSFHSFLFQPANWAIESMSRNVPGHFTTGASHITCITKLKPGKQDGEDSVQ